MMKFCASLVIAAVALADGTHARADVTAGDGHVVIDGVRVDYGQKVVFVGQCHAEDPDDRNQGFALLHAMRIDGRANQDAIQLHLFSGGAANEEALEKVLIALKPNGWYQVTGRIADANPFAIRPEFTVQVEAVERFTPAMGVPVPRPCDFVGRKASFYGDAVDGGIMRMVDMEGRIEGVDQWPDYAAGKRVLASGVIREDADGRYIFTQPTWTPGSLADAAGREVVLEGRLGCTNGQWWLFWFDDSLYVTDAQDRLISPPLSDFMRRVRIKGTLERQIRPSIDQIGERPDRELVPTYVLRRSTIEYLEPAASREERLRLLRRRPAPPSVDGVPVFEAYRSGAKAHPIEARQFMIFNDGAARRIVRDMSPKVVEALAARVQDPTTDPTLRLMYAMLIAAGNDQRGRDYLLTAVRDEKGGLFNSAIYCLGSVPQMLPPDSPIKTDYAWAAPTLLALPGVTRGAEGPGPMAGTITLASVARPLIATGADDARAAVVAFACSGEPGADEAFAQLCDSTMRLSTDDLQKLEQAAATDDEMKRALIAKCLALKDMRALRPLLTQIRSGVAYDLFRLGHSPELVALLKEDSQRLGAVANDEVRLLIALGEPDPPPVILALLADPAYRDKTLPLGELAEYPDARAVVPIAALLRDAPADVFKGRSRRSTDYAVMYALKAIADARTPQSVQELISLFDADLTRFGTSIDRAGHARMIAEKLIEITGESYGVDKDAWRKAYP